MTDLVAYRKSVVTPDVAEALRKLELAGAERGGIRIQYQGVPRGDASWEGVSKGPGPTGLPPHLSMRPSGREVYLSVSFLEGSGDRFGELAVLWGLAVPLGFMPWDRYPVPSPTDRVFHYLGPWSLVGDSLQGEGKGELVWPSICSAAQIEVGTWSGRNLLERTVQSHLHRLGVNCGPVDGLVGERTLRALRALGLGGTPLHEVVGALPRLQPPGTSQTSTRTANLTVPRGLSLEAYPSGDLEVARSHTGMAITVGGKGKLTILFRES